MSISRQVEWLWTKNSVDELIHQDLQASISINQRHVPLLCSNRISCEWFCLWLISMHVYKMVQYFTHIQLKVILFASVWFRSRPKCHQGYVSEQGPLITHKIQNESTVSYTSNSVLLWISGQCPTWIFKSKQSLLIFWRRRWMAKSWFFNILHQYLKCYSSISHVLITCLGLCQNLCC